ncbi:MAG: hypothetical protein ABIF04_06705 [Chloroflexota bacterium]
MTEDPTRLALTWAMGGSVKILNKYRPEEIPEDYKNYVAMCEKGMDILDWYHYFAVGEFFYYPELGINVVERGQNVGCFYCHDPERDIIDFKIKARDSTWLPSEEHLKSLASDINLNQQGLDNFLDDDNGYFDYPKGVKPRSIFTTPEQHWLGYYMYTWHHRIWSKEKRDWVWVKR